VLIRRARNLSKKVQVDPNNSQALIILGPIRTKKLQGMALTSHVDHSMHSGLASSNAESSETFRIVLMSTLRAAPEKGPPLEPETKPEKKIEKAKNLFEA